MDESVDVGGLGGGEDLVLGGLGAAVGDVVVDRATEQPGVLQHHADVGAQLRARHRAGVDPVQGDASLVDLVEPHEQVDQGRLASPGRPDDGDRLARFGDQAEVGDERLVGGVREADVLELDVAACRNQMVLSLRRELLGVQHLEDAFGRGHPRLQQIRHGCDLRHRLGEHPGVLDECLDVTQGHASGNHAQRTDEHDEHVVDVADEEHRRLDRRRDELRLERGLVELLVALVEALDHLLTPSEDLDQGVTGVALLDLGIEHAGGLPHVGELHLGAFADACGDESGSRDDDEAHHGQQR